MGAFHLAQDLILNSLENPALILTVLCLQGASVTAVSHDGIEDAYIAKQSRRLYMFGDI